MTYFHLNSDWPDFSRRDTDIVEPLARVRNLQGRLIGKMEGMGFELRREAVLETLTEDVLKSSEIEGEDLDPDQVRSSIARRLGMDQAGLVPSERHVEGIVEMMLDATQNFKMPLSVDRMKGWHAALFPTGYSGMSKIRVADWRNDDRGPMQVVSGPFGRQTVHFEAPNAGRLPSEMSTFLRWFNRSPVNDPVVKSAIAHLWFVTIHPFDDGNGRIARAVADLALARSDGSEQRFYSMSSQIRRERAGYYNILEATQKGDGDITDWLLWFLQCLERAVLHSDSILHGVLRRAAFWQDNLHVELNPRQRKVVEKLLGPFEGKLTSSKWAKLAKCSQDTALRDITALVEAGVLAKGAKSGRSTHYVLQ